MADTLEFILNGKSVRFQGDGTRTLLWGLRTDFGLTGLKYGCGEGLCGSCTVLVGNEATLSCQMTVNDIAGKEVTTIEGLAKNETLHPLQESFIRHDALQCGFCTPGMILGAHSLLGKNPEPTRDDIITGMEDHLCRCGTHVRIVRAIEDAARVMKGGTK